MASPPALPCDPPPIEAAFRRASEVFEATVVGVPASAWDAPSPCAGWTVRDVVGHVVQSTLKIAALVRDEPFRRDDEHPGDAAGDDPLTAVRDASAAARDAIRAGDTDRTIAASGESVAGALAFPVADLAVHAWDVAHATDRHLALPDELLAHVIATAGRVPEDALRGPGRFGPPQPVDDRADATTRVMAWLGRPGPR